MRKIAIGIIILSFVGIICYGVVVIVVVKGAKNAMDNYSKPDTSITIHNGKSDTLITKKSKPFWAK